MRDFQYVNETCKNLFKINFKEQSEKDIFNSISKFFKESAKKIDKTIKEKFVKFL